jgi:cytochrome c peroxidase
MRRNTILVTAGVVAVLGILSVPHPASAQAQMTPAQLLQPDIPIPPYNPYPALPGFTPPSILPPDIQPELYRVRFEVESIFARYFEEYQALTPTPTYVGNPPVLAPNGYDAQRILGGLLNFDETISPFNNTACASCHMPYVAFSGPIQSVNLTMIAYPGSYRYHANKLTAQRYTYSHTFPVLNYDTTQGLFFGGNFWDGRATGMLLQSADAEQAQGPPVDPGEMGNPDIACIAYKISQAPYRPLFELVWGADFDITWPGNVAEVCATPSGAFGTNATPLALSPEDRTKATNIYGHWGQSLSFLERSNDISPFNSKFDFFLKGSAKGVSGGAVTLTADEMAGYQLFNGKGNCNSCHVDGRSTLMPGQTDTGTTASVQPLFTCHGFANEGLPLNPRVALLYESTPDGFGFTPNPDGFGYRQLGLGNFLRSGPQSFADPNQPEWLSLAPTVDGQEQVMTARDVALTPPQCPTTEAGTGQPYFQKEFFHNGYIKSLKQLVHFYNTRDSLTTPNGNTTFAFPVTSGHCPAGTVEKVTCWPQPEVKNNLDMTEGSQGLTDTEENQIVAFMQTLTDGYNPANPTVSTYKNIDTFTGRCSTTLPGQTASNQGNETLIPTFNLAQFPCAADVCINVPFPPSPPIP